METWRADLHIHSCLSPCADDEATPRAIVSQAKKAGLHLIALTDHNSARNIPAFAEACKSQGIVGVYGSEVNTKEDVHALILFGNPEQAYTAGEEIYRRFSGTTYNREDFREQIYVDENNTVLGSLDKLLIKGTSDMGLNELGVWARSLGGILIPAHIDRPVFGVFDRIGYLPEGPFEAVETTEAISRSITDPWTVTCSSDAHHPRDIGRRHFQFSAPEPSFSGLVNALRNNSIQRVYNHPPGAKESP